MTMHAMRESSSLYRVYSEEEWGNEATEMQGERDGKVEEGCVPLVENEGEEEEEEASCQLSV